MQRLFMIYLSASAAVAILIAFLLLSKPLWRRGLGRSWQYYIWLLAVLRLLIPVSPVPGLIGRALNAGEVLPALEQTEPGEWDDFGEELSYEEIPFGLKAGEGEEIRLEHSLPERHPFHGSFLISGFCGWRRPRCSLSTGFSATGAVCSGLKAPVCPLWSRGC